MGTAVVGLMAFIVVLFATVTALGDLITVNSLNATSLHASWREAERSVDSNLVPLSASVSTTDVDVVLTNSGRLKYSTEDLAGWEVVVRYEDGSGTPHTEYLAYASALATGSWTVQQIYLDYDTLATEIFEPGILNPQEELIIRARLANAPGGSTVNVAMISSGDGPAGSVHFNG